MPLKPSDGAGAYVKDFRKSKAPQFKGKSDKKKQQMAIWKNIIGSTLMLAGHAGSKMLGLIQKLGETIKG